MATFPKPRKPATSATHYEGYEYREHSVDPYWGTVTDNVVEWSALAADGHRAYGSGLPSLLPGWKNPSGYTIWGSETRRPVGSTKWRHDTGVIHRSIVGSADHGQRPPYESILFDAVGSPREMSYNTRQRLNTEVMVKVGARKVSYGEAIAESRSTINHLAKTASSLARAAIAARKGRWGDVARHLGVPKRPNQVTKSLSERWLEYQYGWMPLMSDINDTHKLLKEGFRRPQIMHSVRNLHDTNYYEETNGKFGQYSLEDEGDFRAKVYYRVNDSSMSMLNQMGLINPLEVAWAVMPYSFVVDWFLPVGNVLEALTARFGVDFIGGYYGTRIGCRQFFRQDPDGGYRSECIEHTRAVITHRMAYKRETMSGFPVPGFYLKDPFSSTHVTSALALIRQLSR